MHKSPAWLTRSALLAALAALLVHCGAPEKETTAPAAAQPAPGAPAATASAVETPEFGDALVENIEAEPPTLNVLLSTADAHSQAIGAYIFDALLELDLDSLKMKPSVATKWEISDDHLHYTFYLRKDAKFTDGVPLTTKDLKVTIDLIMNPANDTAVPRQELVDLDTVDLIDDYTIRFNMKRPYFRHLLVLGGVPIVPAHVYATGDLAKNPANRAPLGSGPYKFEKWDTGSQIVLTRNEQYWGKKPFLAKRVFKIIPDNNAAFQALERHDTDIQDIPAEQWARKTNTPKFQKEFQKLVLDSPVPGYLSRFNYVGWNMRQPQLSDKRVRQALCMLFDRQQIIDKVFYGYGTVATTDVYYKAPESNKNLKPWPFDPERAKKLLDEAGWKDTDRDGVRDKDGVKLEFELSYASSVPEYDQLGSVYQEELRRAGVRMTLNPTEWATFAQRVHDRKFDACMLAWITTPFYDGYQLWHSSQAKDGSNYPGFVNAEADKLMEDARVEFDDAKRKVLNDRLQEILHEEQPYIFLYHRPGLVALDARFRGVVQHTMGIDPREWWVPVAMQRYK